VAVLRRSNAQALQVTRRKGHRAVWVNIARIQARAFGKAGNRDACCFALRQFPNRDVQGDRSVFVAGNIANFQRRAVGDTCDSDRQGFAHRRRGAAVALRACCFHPESEVSGAVGWRGYGQVLELTGFQCRASVFYLDDRVAGLQYRTAWQSGQCNAERFTAIRIRQDGFDVEVDRCVFVACCRFDIEFGCGRIALDDNGFLCRFLLDLRTKAFRRDCIFDLLWRQPLKRVDNRNNVCFFRCHDDQDFDGRICWSIGRNLEEDGCIRQFDRVCAAIL